MTRIEHINWCKERAKQEFEYYLKNGGLKEAIQNGITSMMSDLGKHSETQSPMLNSLCMMEMLRCKTAADFHKFINGFN